MFVLCLIAVLAALGGLAAVGVALGSAATAGFGLAALLAAPAFGAMSVATGTAAAVIALRRAGAPRLG